LTETSPVLPHTATPSQQDIDMKQEHSPLAFPATSEAQAPTTAQQGTASKKRTAPKSDKKKSGAGAAKKPAAKKRKIEKDSKDDTPFSQRSATPTSSRASKTPGPRYRQQNSATPGHSSPVPESQDAEDEDVDEDAEVFCICRKPDDHTWMIACDAGCDDWFHGRCVNIKEDDGNLIDKYICKSINANGPEATSLQPLTIHRSQL
jgi:COMPASS component SPP1